MLVQPFPGMTLLLMLRYWGDCMIVQTIIRTIGGGDLSDVTLWIADFSTWDGVTVTDGDKDGDGREITA